MKKYRIAKNTNSKEKKKTLSKDKLYQLYQKEISKFYYKDTVLLVLGGEYGVINEYLIEKYKPSSLIVIEPNPYFYNNALSIKNHKQLSEKVKNLIYLPVPEIEKNTKHLLNALLKTEIFVNGMEIIINPYYQEHFPEGTAQEENKLRNYLDKMKNIRKGLSSEILDITQAKLNLTQNKLKEVLGEESLDFDQLFKESEPDVGDGSLVILIGGEFNYYTSFLMNNSILHNLIIIEPSKLFAENENVRKLNDKISFNDSKSVHTFYFSEGEKEHLNFFEIMKKKLTYIKNTKILINPIYESYMTEDLSNTVKIVAKYLKDGAILKGNSVADDLYGMGNSLYNLKNTDNMKVFKDLPQFDNVISVAAGPSLDDHLDELKELSKRYPVIAVEVIANKLVKEGIIPDIVCSQERTYNVFKITNEFLPEILEQSVYMAPTLIHPFIPDALKNYVIFVQPKKSPLERYLSENYYDFTHIYPQSIYAGEVNMLSAMLFHPKNILLFGHDLAITHEKVYADNTNGETPYSIENSKKETGNRGKDVYVESRFEIFRNNTEVMLASLKQENDVNILTFSDGAVVKHIENATQKDYENFINSGNDKNIRITDYLVKSSADSKEIKDKINKELSIIQEQIFFLENMEKFSRYTIMAKFTELLIRQETICTGVSRLLLDEFIEKHMYVQENMDLWVKKNRDEFLSIYKMVEGVIQRTHDYLNGIREFPNDNSSYKELFENNFFSVIRERAYNKDKSLKTNLEKQTLKYILLSFYYSLQRINYFDMSKLLGELKQYIEDDEDARQIYYEGINREIELYKLTWNKFKDSEKSNKGFFRYQLASFNYEAGNIEWVIEFLSNFDDLGLPEKVLLADAYMDSSQYETAFLLFKEALNDNQSARVIINAFHCLIMAGKIAEATLFKHLFFNTVRNYDAFKKNQELLKEKTEKLMENNQYTLSTINDENSNDYSSFDFNNLSVPHNISDEICKILAQEQHINIYQLNIKRGIYYFAKDKKINLSYFLTKRY